jgi:hypothetical protein
VVVGAAFEVVNVVNTDGSLNSIAKEGPYKQFPQSITESSFPDPRNNIDELVIQIPTVRPFILNGGVLSELLMNPGSAFLEDVPYASKAAIQTVIFNGATGLALAGTTMIFVIDQPVRLNTSRDVTITFTGSGNLTSAQAAAQLNTAAGATIARVVGTAPNDKVEIDSLTYGALSSVTIRQGGSANSVLQIGYSSGSSAHEERVEGAGWRGQDQGDGTTQTSFIEFYRGNYVLDGTDTAFVSKAGMYNITDTLLATFNSAQEAAVAFGTGGGQIPLVAGDDFWADGSMPKGAEVMKVESARFRIGTIDTTLSVVDNFGHYVTKVFDPVTVGTILDSSPFSPQWTYFRANGLDWTTVTPTPEFVTGGVSASAATHGVVTGTGAGAGPFSLAGLTLNYISTINGIQNPGTFTFVGGPFANMAAVEAAIGSSIPGVSVGDNGGGPPQLQFTTTGTGAANAIDILHTGTANTTLGFSTVSDTVGTGVDPLYVSLAGTQLQFQLDLNPHVYTFGFTTNSLYDAVNEINNTIGATVASVDGTGRKIIITSFLAGIASAVNIITPSPTSAETVLGLTSGTGAVTTAGTGRPFPDAYIDDADILHIQAEILRDPVTGYPLDQSLNSGTLYIQFKALRLDVSPVAEVAGVIRVSDPNVLSTILNPLTTDNPLGLGLFLCMLNAPLFEVKGLGIDTVTSAAPYGTADAWARSAAMLEAEEVYSIAPLSQDEIIDQLWQTHVTVMSQPDQAGERIVFFNKMVPTRANPTIALSGTNANSTATPNTMVLDGNPSAGLIAAGINPALPIPETAGVYMTFEVAGEQVNYNVSSVNGALVTFRTTFSSPTTNEDGFYTTTTLNVSVVDAAYSLNVRGASLIIPGSNPPKLDPQLIANNVSQANAAIGNRRVYEVFPDTVQTTINGLTVNVPGFYACAAIAGQVGAQPPQQPLTNFPITGLVGVVNPVGFTRNQLNLMAGGGTYILIQDVPNGPVYSRHQLSTDLTSIETRELSITKDIDFVAKFMRVSLRKFIGKNVIDKDLLSALGTTIHAILAFLEEAGVLNGSNLNQLVQDENNPDTVLVDITLDVPFPCNYIRLVLAV